jgi:hypothetical protein
VRAAPDRLDAFTEAGRDMVADLDRTAGTLGRALDDLRDAPGRGEFLADVPPLDVHLREATQRLELLAGLTSALSRRLRDLDADASVVDSRLDLRLLLGVLGDLARFRPPPVTPDYDPARWLATEEGAEALAQVRALLEPGWLGVPASNLEDLQRLVAALPPVLADAVVHGLTDAEVQRLVDALDQRWLPGYGFDRARRQEFWAVVGARVSLVSFRRLAAVTDDLDPPPATALDDAATDRPQRREFYDALIYRPFEGWLTWQGEGDPHAISRNDTTQGRIGNCYLIAAMMGIADHDPTRLEGMITENRNGTFTVHFADGQRVVVSPDLPVHPDDPTRPVFSGYKLSEDDYDTPAGRYELWPSLLEKAYAQKHGGWGETVGGWPGETITELVGGQTTRLDPTTTSPSELAEALGDGKIVTLATLRDPGEAGQEVYQGHELLTGQHAYVVTHVTGDGRIELHNPWEAEHAAPLLITEDELKEIGWHIEVNELP